MELGTVRKRIDAIDSQITALLTERLGLGLAASRLKREIADPSREALVLSRIRAAAAGPLSQRFAEELFREIIRESRALQEKRPKLAGFQGCHGANSESAALALAPGHVPFPCATLRDVFSGVERGSLDVGVIPVENSIAGEVEGAAELLAAPGSRVVGELVLPVRHALLASFAASSRGLRAVYSHPQALRQCRCFLSRAGLEGLSFYDTAGAARMIALERKGDTGAIASARCAELYGLRVVQDGIEDSPKNATRFVMITRAREPTARSA